MAAETSGKTSTEPRVTPATRRLKSWMLRLLILAAIGGAAGLGWREYRKIQQHRMVEMARESIGKKDFKRAAASIQGALALNPRNIAANRMMVEVTEAAGSKEAIYWHRVIAELEPKVAANQVALADCALRHNEPAIAEQALALVGGDGRNTATFHDAAGRLALSANQIADAEKHFAEAAKLEPANEEFQLHAAAARMQSDNAEIRNGARETVERFLPHAKLGRVAARALLDNLFRNKEWEKALGLSKQIQSAPDAVFGDRMLYLGLLRRFKQPQFNSYLLTLQDQAADDAEKAASLISWLSGNGLVLVAVEWAKRLPEETAAKMPVPLAIGECYALQHNWQALKPLVTETNWEHADFLRMAFLARVQRESGDALSSRNSWTSAVKAAVSRPDELILLTRYATKWGWEDEATDVLWTIARGNAGQQSALNILAQNYAAKGNPRGMLNVFSRMFELNPKDVVAQNNVVLLSLLLNFNMERAQAMADEAYKQQPNNPVVTSTYAFALFLRGRTEDGIKLMRGLDEKQRADPSCAAYFAAMLVESETPEEAGKYIEIAQTGRLLPEEMALVKTARESLVRRGIHGASASKP